MKFLWWMSSSSLVLLTTSCRAFLLPPLSVSRCRRWKPPPVAFALKKNTNLKPPPSSSFLSKAEFDLLSLRSWRRETLFRYSTANQSEPLRIFIFLTLTLCFLFSFAIADAVGAPPPEPVLPLASVGTFGLFWRERSRRTRRLLRLERECLVADLSIIARRNVVVGGQRETTVRSLRKERRLVAVAAPAEVLARVEAGQLLPLRRRLEAAKVDVVLVATDAPFFKRTKGTSVCDPADPDAWRRAFDELLSADPAWGSGGSSGGSEEGNKTDDDAVATTTAFFALGFDGRSCASAATVPNFLELLGANFPPLNFQGAGAPVDAEPGLPEQAAFYDALTNGDLAKMETLFGQVDDADVDAVLDAGGRLDPWTSQLRDDNRPSTLVVTDADVAFADDGLSATTTAVEATDDQGKTLLAVQRWTRQDDHWRLLSHATVPFAPNVAAGALLRCDHRGCVLLVNARQQ